MTDDEEEAVERNFARARAAREATRLAGLGLVPLGTGILITTSLTDPIVAADSPRLGLQCPLVSYHPTSTFKGKLALVAWCAPWVRQYWLYLKLEAPATKFSRTPGSSSSRT